jgi:hypothetical protein
LFELDARQTGPRILDPRTARGHREHSENARCLQRIAQALKQLMELVGVSIEFKSCENHEVDFAHLARLLKQDMVQTNLRDVRLVDGGGSLLARKKLLLALMKMCGPSQARCVDFDHHPEIVNFFHSPGNTQKQVSALCVGSEGHQSVDGHVISRLEVFDICRLGFRFLQQLVLID